MKRVELWVITLLLLATFSCKEENDDYQSVKYTAEDIEGTWLWISSDGNPAPYNQIFWANYQDGKAEYWNIDENGKWVTETSTYTFENNIITGIVRNKAYKVIYADAISLIFESQETNTRVVAQKVINTDIKNLVGIWYNDSLNTEINFKEDSTRIYTVNDIAYPEKYGVCNDFYWYSSEDGSKAGFCHYSVDMGKSGPEFTRIWVDTDGTIYTDVFLRKQMEDYTLEDMVGTWRMSTMDGEQLPLSSLSIAVTAEDGQTVFHSMKEDQWTSMNCKMSIDKNVLTLAREGESNLSFSILYCDNSTQIMMTQDGKIFSNERILFPDENKERILGLWENEAATSMGDMTTDMKCLITKDSIYHIEKRSDSETADSSIRSYELYGDILVQIAADHCQPMFVSFSYDKEREQRVMNHHLMFSDGSINTTTLYGRNLKDELCGMWLWWKRNGEYLPTDQISLTSYQANGVTTDISFLDGYLVEPSKYSLTNNMINYLGDEDYPYDEILFISDSSIVGRSFNNDIYEGIRINVNNPLRESIIGEWTCDNYVGTNGAHGQFTQKFEANGVHVVTYGDKTLYGTYQLFDKLLVHSWQEDGEENVRVSFISIDNGILTQSRLLSDGNIITNSSIKKQ